MTGWREAKRMSWRTGTLRGCIGARWDAAGQPGWDVERLVQVARECDVELELAGKNPAPAFRRNRKKGNREYEAAWVRFLQAPWF